MRLIRHGVVYLSIICLSLAYLVGCINSHEVIFVNEACIIPFKGYNYKTCQAMQVSIDGKSYTIPKSFETDLASIPRVLWPILAPQYCGFVAPAILHDYLYRCNNNVTRKFADEVLYSALITEHVTSFTAYKFYLGVRLFGGSHFEHGVCE